LRGDDVVRISHIVEDPRVLRWDECGSTSHEAATSRRALYGAECIKRYWSRMIYHGRMTITRLFAQPASNLLLHRLEGRRDGEPSVRCLQADFMAVR
jgi:hypothetical protein